MVALPGFTAILLKSNRLCKTIIGRLQSAYSLHQMLGAGISARHIQHRRMIGNIGRNAVYIISANQTGCLTQRAILRLHNQSILVILTLDPVFFSRSNLLIGDRPSIAVQDRSLGAIYSLPSTAGGLVYTHFISSRYAGLGFGLASYGIHEDTAEAGLVATGCILHSDYDFHAALHLIGQVNTAGKIARIDGIRKQNIAVQIKQRHIGCTLRITFIAVQADVMCRIISHVQSVDRLNNTCLSNLIANTICIGNKLREVSILSDTTHRVHQPFLLAFLHTCR